MMRAADKESSAGQSHWTFTAPQCFLNGVIKDLVMSYSVRATRHIYIQAANLAGFRASEDPRFEAGIPDFMNGILNFSIHFNVVHRKVDWRNPKSKMKSLNSMPVYIKDPLQRFIQTYCRVSCRPFFGGRLPPKNQLLPPKSFTDFIFIHPEPPTSRLLPPPPKVLQLPPKR